jgi:hypothetical protein
MRGEISHSPKAQKALLAKTHLWSIQKAYGPKVVSAIIKAANNLRASVNLSEITKILKTDSSHKAKADMVMQALGFKDFRKHLVAQGLQDVLLDAYRRGAVMGAAQLPKRNIARATKVCKIFRIQKAPKQSTSLDANLDITNQATIDFLQTYLPELIVEINSQQAQAVLTLIQNGFTSGWPVDEIARSIRGVVGLTAQQAQYVANFENQLITGELDGLTAPWERRLSASTAQQALSEFNADEVDWDNVAMLTDKYAQSLLNNRALNISRTEVHNASTEGQKDLWNQAKAQGLMPKTTRRHWLGTDDGKEREAHVEVEDMNPDGVPFNEPFQTPVGPVMYPGKSGVPSFDINCRCTTFLTFDEPVSQDEDDSDMEDQEPDEEQEEIDPDEILEEEQDAP